MELRVRPCRCRLLEVRRGALDRDALLLEVDDTVEVLEEVELVHGHHEGPGRRSRGAEVACAAGSDEAVARARPLPDLLILDRHLADGTGEACHRRLIAEAGVCCPVLLVSADSAVPPPAGHPRSIVLRKPVAPDVLFGAIGRLLDAAA